MPKKESSARLRKGLSTVSGEDVDNVLEDIQQGKIRAHKDSKFEVKVKNIKPSPYQPRKNFDGDKIRELIDSIKLYGVFTPILVKKATRGCELIAGEHQLWADKVAKLKTIPAVLVEFDGQQMMEIILLGSIQRENLNAAGETQGYEKLAKKLGCTQEELAKRIGKPRRHVANALQPLKFPGSVQQCAIDKQPSMGHVRTLLGLKDVSQIEGVAEKAIQLRLSVHAVEVPAKNTNESESTPEEKQWDINLNKVRDRLQNRFQIRVRIDKKQVTIRYDDNEDLNHLLEMLGGIEEEQRKSKSQLFRFHFRQYRKRNTEKEQALSDASFSIVGKYRTGRMQHYCIYQQELYSPFCIHLRKGAF